MVRFNARSVLAEMHSENEINNSDDVDDTV